MGGGNSAGQASLFLARHAACVRLLVREDALSRNSYILTGADATGSGKQGAPDSAGRPYPLETSRAGVFAAGDVRSGSVKRVASAVGEGAMAVQLIHDYLQAGE
ncbi:hypothetical protein Acor_57110 [Acrocarpospora corrugata]|uniref:FAD/NAD(P)-binding domain-containing protein n=1 Tax=Acrocarpospora corrugata TaxID=35763 RepID=A0A5M3W3N1_9ACTN|nr:NAD(P)/FAD-dependent oxidoreductase [Acrocarpospora corrugata]GES03645.1 hypothetical protein Acor_57110 [Acrocarpospora corrugata]